MPGSLERGTLVIRKGRSGDGPPFSFDPLPAAAQDKHVHRLPSLSLFAEEARTLFQAGPRLIDEFECALSVSLAILFAHLLHAEHVSWAAFSGYAVMRSHVSETLLRGTLRIIGTVAGAGLALVAVPVLLRDLPVGAVSVAAGVVGAASLYGAIAGKRAYAWLFFGLTFEMILLDKLERPDTIVSVFASTRCLEVIAGTGACVLVSLLSTLTLRRVWRTERPAPPAKMEWHPNAFRHACQAGVAVAVLPLLWSTFQVPALAQSAITVLATMLVPLTSLGTSGFRQVSQRLAQRVMGCVMGAVLAAVVLFAAQGSPILLMLGVLNGVILGRHLENSGTSVAYVGTQFVLSVLVVLVPDSFENAEIAPALERLTGIFIGIGVLEPILVLWHIFASKAPAADPERGTGESV